MGGGIMRFLGTFSRKVLVTLTLLNLGFLVIIA